MGGSPAVIADDEAGDVHRLEIRQGETGKARQVVIVPAGVGRADQATAVSVVGEDDAIISERDDDNGCLWTGGGTRGSLDGSLQAIDLARGSGHGATGWRR